MTEITKSITFLNEYKQLKKALEEGKYPDWDADNETSAHLAQKLGYCLEERYPTVMIENEMI